MQQTATIEKQLVSDGLSFPTCICFGSDGNVYVAESGMPWDGAPPGGRVFQLLPGRNRQLLADKFRHPITGLCWFDGALIVSEGGFPGRISRLSTTGERSTILDNLPGLGNYHTNMVAPGPDGKLYFSQGAMTNMGVIGTDAYLLDWLGQLPQNWDVPGYPVTLTGQTFETPDPLSSDTAARAFTGAFAAFGESHAPGTKLEASLPCTAAMLRCNPDGSELELVAWGLRNAYGLGFLPDGRLITTDQGSDDRGSRPIGQAPESVFEVKPGAWYGWPDYVAGIPVTDLRYTPSRGPALEFILSRHEELPPPEKPLLTLPVNSAATKFDCLPLTHPTHPGQLVLALFGDEKPVAAPPGHRSGRNLVRINPADWSWHPLPDLQLNRPIDVRYNASDDTIWILDFGIFEMTDKDVAAQKETGKLWKINASDLLFT